MLGVIEESIKINDFSYLLQFYLILITTIWFYQNFDGAVILKAKTEKKHRLISKDVLFFSYKHPSFASKITDMEEQF